MRARRTELALVIMTILSAGLLWDRFGPSLLLWRAARSEPVALEIRDLARGSFRMVDGHGSRLLVVRTAQDEVRAFTVPLHGGKVAMPAAQWGRSAYDCADFGPDSSGGVLTANAVFRCRDEAVPQWGGARWRWNLDGSAAPLIEDSYISELPRVSVVRSGDTIRIYRWDIIW